MRGVRSVAVEALIGASKAAAPIYRPPALARLLAAARGCFEPQRKPWTKPRLETRSLNETDANSGGGKGEGPHSFS